MILILEMTEQVADNCKTPEKNHETSFISRTYQQFNFQKSISIRSKVLPRTIRSYQTVS